MIREVYSGSEWIFPFILYRSELTHSSLPLVIQLHGAGEVGNGGDELELADEYGFSSILKSGKEYPCIVVMPQCPPDTFWSAELYRIHEFIAQLKRNFCLDENRISLTGTSMGGYGTWAMACRFPDEFSAIAPVCGGGMAWKTRALKMPVWAFHGTEDDTVEPIESIMMIDRLKQHRPEDETVHLTMFEGMGHEIRSASYTEELLIWLISQRRPE